MGSNGGIRTDATYTRHAGNIVRGTVSRYGAAGDTTFTDGTTTANGTQVVVAGGTVADQGDGVIQISTSGLVDTFTNASGSDLAVGQVVVVNASGQLVTTTTAQDTRPVGVVVAPITAGNSGPVVFTGFVALVDVTASVTAGTYLETSTTAGEATTNGTRRTGSFGYVLTGGTTPTAFLFGIPDTASSDVPTGFLTTTEGEQHALVTIADAGSASTLDCSLGNIFDLTLTANCTLTITNPPPAGVGGIIQVILRQGGSGSYTVTWPASVKWPDSSGGSTGSAPTLHTAVGAQDDVELATLDGGTTWGGSVRGGGTVTSVAITVPAEFSVSGSPVTSSGTLAISKANESANTAWMGPTSGSAAAPTFRALAQADMPGHYEILMASGSADPLTTSDGLDYLYVWVPGA